jgi:PAS domain S-box-containing protein
VDDQTPQRGDSSSNGLSTRERQLLTYAAQGFTDQGIAHKLGISLATVGTYWGRIRIKMGPLNRTELVAHFLQEAAAQTVGELRSQNEALLAQIDEHAKTSEMLRASLEMFRGLLETAPDAIIVVNDEGVIELANEQAEELFGYGKDRLLGLVVEELVPERYHNRHRANRSQYNSNPVKRRMGEHLATMARRKDGTEFPMATALSATITPRGLLVTCIVRDLTDRLNRGREVPANARAQGHAESGSPGRGDAR